MHLFRRKQSAPPTIPTDLIIPLNYWDDQPHTRALCLDVTLRFNDVLDPEKVRLSLVRLLEIGDWRKLGARLRQNSAGKLEYHVPAEFHEKRPGFMFSAEGHDMRIADHPVASRLPIEVAKPCTFGGTGGFRPFLCSSQTPDGLDGWLYSDQPQLAIHLITFNDATLLTVTFLHTLMDTMGLSALLTAWTAVLRGEEDKVLPFVGFDHDPLAPLSEQPLPAPYILADKVLQGFAFLVFMFHLLLDLLWYRQESERVIFLPGKYVDQMREAALASLAEQVTDSEKPFLSDSDILISWASRSVITAIETALSRTVLITNVFSGRGILEELGLVPSTGAALITNAVFPSYTLISARDMLEKPLSFVALQIRRSLEKLRSKEQVRAVAVFQKNSVDKSGQSSLFGDSSLQLLVWTNWEKAKLFQVDFSSAVVEPEVDVAGRANPLGRPSYVNCIITARGMPLRNIGSVIGRDHAGNWWLTYNLREGAWAKFEQQLESMWKTSTPTREGS